MKKLAISLVKGYQKVISPLFPPSCRYYPTCSNYTVQALEKHGAVKGSIMGIARIIRCNPFVRGGVDKVPSHFTLRRNPADRFAMGTIPPSKRTEEDQAKMKDEIDCLYEEFKEDVVVHVKRPKASEAAEKLVDVEEKDISLLSAEYMERVKATVLSLTDQPLEASENLKFHLYEVVRSETNENYFSHIHLGELNKALGDELGERIGILVEESYGVYESSSPELALDIQLEIGVTHEDIEKKTEHLLHYLYLLETIYE